MSSLTNDMSEWQRPFGPVRPLLGICPKDTSGYVGKTFLIKHVHHSIYNNAKDGGSREDGQTDLTTERGPGGFTNRGISCFVLQHEQQTRGPGQTRIALLDYSQAGKAGHRHVGVVGSQTHVSIL